MVKKLLLLSITLLMSYTFAFDFSLNLKGGVNFLLAESTDYDEYLKDDDLSRNNDLGFNGSLGLEIGLADIFAIQPEFGLIHASETWSSKYEDFPEFNSDDTYVINYFSIPVLFKFRFLTDKTVSLNAFAGPGFNFLLGAEDTYSVFDETIDTTENYASFVLSLVLGGGVDIKVSDNIAIVTDIRYTMGLTEINSDAYIEDIEEVFDEAPAEVLFNGISANIGISFKLK